MEGHPCGLHLYLSISRLKKGLVFLSRGYYTIVNDRLGNTAQVYHGLMWAELRGEKLDFRV